MHAEVARRLVLVGLYKRIEKAAALDGARSLNLYHSLSDEHIAELRNAGYRVQVRDEYDSIIAPSSPVVVISWK